MADAEYAALQKLTTCSIDERGSRRHTHKTPVSARRAAVAPVTVAPPLRVAYRTALDGEICASMVAQLVQFLLYFRGQIPMMYPALRHTVIEHEYEQAQERAMRKKRRLIGNRPVKKAIKCINTAERLFAGSLHALFAGRVHSALLIFGPSVVSPREVYVLDFVEHAGDNATIEEQEASPALSKEKTARLCAQKLVRTLVAVSTQRLTSNLSATSLHVVALAEKRSTPIPGFVPKQNFRLRLPRTNKQGNRTHHIILSGANNLPSTIPSMIGNEHQDTQAGSESDVIKVAEPWFCQKNVALGQDLIWYAFDKPVAGFTGVV